MAHTRVLIAVGGNSAHPGGSLSQTIATIMDRVAAVPELEGACASPLYRTPAWPAGSGPDYVNAAIAARSAAAPEVILARLHRIEADFGRTRVERWAARVCDLDLLAVGDAVLPSRGEVEAWIAADPEAGTVPGGLVLPHPRLHRRAFVLMPLADVAPDWVHPVLGRPVAEMLAALPEADRAACVRL